MVTVSFKTNIAGQNVMSTVTSRRFSLRWSRPSCRMRNGWNFHKMRNQLSSLGVMAFAVAGCGGIPGLCTLRWNRIPALAVPRRRHSGLTTFRACDPQQLPSPNPSPEAPTPRKFTLGVIIAYSSSPPTNQNHSCDPSMSHRHTRVAAGYLTSQYYSFGHTSSKLPR